MKTSVIAILIDHGIMFLSGVIATALGFTELGGPGFKPALRNIFKFIGPMLMVISLLLIVIKLASRT